VDITPFVGPAFRYFREKAKESQEQTAFSAGLDRTYISGLERGVRNPSLQTMQKLAVALGIGLDVVFVKARRLAEQPAPRPKRRVGQ